MKLILTLLVTLTAITSLGANKRLDCEPASEQKYGGLSIGLDQSTLGGPGSQYAYIQYTYWSFMYSSAELICSTKIIGLSRKENFSCIGYNSAGGLIEVSFDITQGKGKAKVKIIGENVYKDLTDGLNLECSLKEI